MEYIGNKEEAKWYILEDFIYEFQKIKEYGWILTHRSGSTGVGKTLEDLLGIIENNYDEPDFCEYELKSCRVESNSMLLLFAKTPQPLGAVNHLRETFGYLFRSYNNPLYQLTTIHK